MILQVYNAILQYKSKVQFYNTSLYYKFAVYKSIIQVCITSPHYYMFQLLYHKRIQLSFFVNCSYECSAMLSVQLSDSSVTSGEKDVWLVKLNSVFCRTLYNPRCPFHTVHFVLYIPHCTLYTEYASLYTKHCTLHSTLLTEYSSL